VTSVVELNPINEFLKGDSFSFAVNGHNIRVLDSCETVHGLSLLLDRTASVNIEADTLTITTTSGSVFSFVNLTR
jgi:hypothetical protein